MREESCPDESSFAELAAGCLTSEHRKVLEAHIDRCDACNELLSVLAGLRDPNVAKAGDDPTGPSRRWWLTDMAAAAGSLLIVQLVWCAVWWKPALTYFDTSRVRADDWASQAYFGYGAVAGWVGPLVGALAVLGTWRRWKATPRIITIQALLSLPTGSLAPVALAALYHLHQARKNGRTCPSRS